MEHERLQDWFSRAKAHKLGLSHEQVPILIAADRVGSSLGHTPPALNVDNVKNVLQPVVAPDALLNSDANCCNPPVAEVLSIAHQSINLSVGDAPGGPCTYRRPTTAIASLRASCGTSAEPPPSSSTAISDGSIPSNSMINLRLERTLKRRWPRHAHDLRIEPKAKLRVSLLQSHFAFTDNAT